MNIRVGTWMVRILCRAGSMEIVASEKQLHALNSKRERDFSTVQLQLSVQLPRGINMGPIINRLSWFFASQNMWIMLFRYLCKSKLCYDRRLVGQSVLVSSTHLGLKTQIFITVRQLRVSSFGDPSLTRRRFCRLQLLLVFSRAVILGSESRGTHDLILLSQIRDSPNLEGQVLVFISFRNRMAQLYPQVLGSLFIACYDSPRATVEVFEPAFTRVVLNNL
jgi:hypothetical protein